MSETEKQAWASYWQAYKAGDVEAMRKAYARIETTQRIANSRRTTVKILAAVLA